MWAGSATCMFLGSVDGQKVVLFALDSRGKWLAGML